MKRTLLAITLAGLVIGIGAVQFTSAQGAQAVPPPWAFTVNPPATPGAVLIRGRMTQSWTVRR